MKDLTHYFQSPGKETESESPKKSKELVKVPDEIADNLKKVQKSISKKGHTQIEDFNKKRHKDRKSPNKQEGSKESKTANDENSDSVKQSNKLKKEDDSASHKSPIKSSANKVQFLQKQTTKKKKLSTRKSSSESADKSTSCDSTKEQRETHIKESTKEKSHISSKEEEEVIDISASEEQPVNGLKRNSKKLVKEALKKKRKSELSRSRSENHIQKTNVEDCEIETKNKNYSEEKSPVLSERNNAFIILMSSRVWHSPTDKSCSENEDGNEASSDKKKTKFVAETVDGEVKELRKKRKKELEKMVERKVKKVKLSETSPAEKKRILIVPESDSEDDQNAANLSKIEMKNKKFKDDKSDLEETNNKNKPTVVKKLTKRQDKEIKCAQLAVGEKTSANASPRSVNKNKNLHRKNKRIIEETDDSSEQEEEQLSVKKAVMKSQKESPSKLKKKSRELCKDAGKEVERGIKEKELKKKKIFNKEDTVSNGNVFKAKSELKSPRKPTPKNNKNEKTPSKDSEKEDESKECKLLNRSGLLNAKKKSNVNTDKENGSEITHKKTPLSKKEKTIDVAPDSTNVAKKEISKEHKSPDCADEGKKRNSLFSYFSKVSKEDSLRKSEKFEVKAQIHSPPVSPSKKRRSLNTVGNIVEERRRSLRNRVTDKEDQIVVLESNIVDSSGSVSSKVERTPKKKGSSDLKSSNTTWRMRVKLRESSVELESGGSNVDDDNDGDGGGEEEEEEEDVDDDDDDDTDSDEYILTPKKKWTSNKTSVQQKAAREVLKKAKTRTIHELRNPTTKLDSDIQNVSNEDDVVCISHVKDSAPVKLAPLFLRTKSVPKPKLDPALVEARQNFLKSGVPESVKKLVDLQRSIEEQYHFTFPSVAHVQQRDDHSVWNLPLIESPVLLSEMPTFLTVELMASMKLGSFNNCSNSVTLSLKTTKPSAPIPITHFRKLLHFLKLESPNIPIYRNFRRLRTKFSNHQEVDKVKHKKKSGRKSRMTRSEAKVEEQKKENFNKNTHVMWTEKYKPTTVEDIIGNGHSIDQLKTWLETWKRFSDEVQRKEKGSDRKRKDSSSGDEFLNSDSNESNNGNPRNNTAILVGPHGCGKTSAVYAIANELGCKVLEINASSKRTGKRILSELQEATQSHQVRAGGENLSGGLNSFFKKDSTKPKKRKPKASETSEPKQNGDDHSSSKMSLILVESVDVVYEDQDEGFISALNSLVISSKRPVILVTSEPRCPHLARFMDQHLVLKFSAPSSTAMSAWLQLVCLLEGIRVKRGEIEKLLDQNFGDVRQTMLQLQFWVLTGGNTMLPDDGKSELLTEKPSSEIISVDEHSNLSWACGDETEETPVDIPEHGNFTEIFTEYSEKNKYCQLPFPVDLGVVWWNLASLLSMSDNLYKDKIFVQQSEDVNETGDEDIEEIDCVMKCTDAVEVIHNDQDTNVERMEVEKETTCAGIEDSNDDKVMEELEGPKNVSDNDCNVNSVEKVDVEEKLGESVNVSEMKEVELPDDKGAEKNVCSQLEIDSMSRLMEKLSALEVLTGKSSISNEPGLRSWDRVPKDGTSLNEDVHHAWWENTVSNCLCHHLLESSVNECRLRLQEAQGCEDNSEMKVVTYTRPTQQELRWRLAQHASFDAILPAVPLWGRSDHHSVASDYNPMLRSVCRCEQGRLVTNTKRRNRFFHYLKGLNVHASDATFDTLCALFNEKHVT